MLLLFALQAGFDDAYVAGYATAILEREFSLKGVQVRFADGVLTLQGDAWGETDKEKVVAAVSKIPRVIQVVLRTALRRPEPMRRGGSSFRTGGSSARSWRIRAGRTSRRRTSTIPGATTS